VSPLGTRPSLPRRVRDSVFRVGWPRSERQRLAVMVSSFFLHIHPARVRSRTLDFSRTLGLGLISLYLLLILVATGVPLMLYYTPHPSEAYPSMLDLEYAVAFGRVTRNMHRWAAHAMVLTAFLHMCRVFFTGGYKPPRQLNWVVGVGLLALTLGLSFTGYLLPWDQLAFWAITVGTSIAAYLPLVGDDLRRLLLGGNQIGAAALLRFYVLHCVILPLLALPLAAFHLWRIRKDGGLSTSKEERPTLVSTWPHLLFRELLLLLAVVAALNLAALLFDAPLEAVADASRTPNPAKAPWYFLGLQELVHHSALLGGVVVPVGALLALVALPYLDDGPQGAGIWFSRERRLANAIFAALALGAVGLTLIGTFFRGPSWGWVWPWTG